MSNIIDFITHLQWGHLPPQAIHTARLCLLDAVGCVAAGICYEPVQTIAQRISLRHPGATQIAGTALTAERSWAAFANTHACTFFDLDDGHRKAQGHPGGVIVPLALMLAAEKDRTGKELITAIVAGYETAVRSALVMRRAGGPRKGSGAWSVTGGVASAAKLNGLSAPELKNALGLSEYYAPQAPQDRSLGSPSPMKEGMAWASFTALTAVELASLGFEGMDPFLLDADECDDLGSTYEIGSVYFKQYACCRFSHPVLDGLDSLVRQYAISADHIESITIESFAKAVLLERTAPENPVAAMYSIPYAVGCTLARGCVGPAEMTETSLADGRILDIARKVKIVEDPKLTAVFPEKCLARVTIRLKNGDTVKSDTLAARGDPATPYTLEEMRSKFLRISEPLLGQRSGRLYELIMDIENRTPREIWEMLR